MRAISAAMLVMLCSSSAADQVVIAAVPETKVTSSSASTERHRLAESDRTKSLLVIQKTAHGYRWATRDNRELLMTKSGSFAYFIDPSGGGYVKVATAKGAAPLLDNSCGDGFAYFEHLSLGVVTITYFGCAAELHL